MTDPAEGHQRWREGRDALLRSHPASPIVESDRAAFAGLDVADYDARYRYEAEVDRSEPTIRVEIPTSTDGTLSFERLGTVRLAGIGDLDVWWLLSYAGGVFLPVRDALAGAANYGGGRYVLDTIKGADLGSVGDRIVVDFNFAYNPSCAYDPAWSCPLAPPGNVVNVELPIGERAYSTANWRQ
jgi:uncharacterized protein (DUF1684 family)